MAKMINSYKANAYEGEKSEMQYVSIGNVNPGLVLVRFDIFFNIFYIGLEILQSFKSKNEKHCKTLIQRVFKFFFPAFSFSNSI